MDLYILIVKICSSILFGFLFTTDLFHNSTVNYFPFYIFLHCPIFHESHRYWIIQLPGICSCYMFLFHISKQVTFFNFIFSFNVLFLTIIVTIEFFRFRDLPLFLWAAICSTIVMSSNFSSYSGLQTAEYTKKVQIFGAWKCALWLKAAFGHVPHVRLRRFWNSGTQMKIL